MQKNVIVLIAGFAGVTFGLIWNAGHQLRAQSGQWQPYTIVRTADSTNSATGHELHRVEIVARRSDGSRVVVQSADPGTKSELGVRDFVLSSEHKRIEVNDHVKMLSTYYTDSFAGPPTDPMCDLAKYSPTAKAALKGEHEVLGFRTLIIQTENGPFLTEDSKAPALACETLQMSEFERETDGQPTGRRFEMIATQILRGEPDQALFRIPTDYVEAAPSKILQAIASRHPLQPPPDAMLKRYEEMDREYTENHRVHGVQ